VRQSDLFIKPLQGFAVLSLPHDESVRTASVNNGSGSGRAAELSILSEDQEAVLLGERTVSN